MGNTIHDAARPSADCIRKGPEVELVHSHVVNVRAKSVQTETRRRRSLAEVFLFVENVVFGGGHDTGSLDSLDGLADGDSGKNWVW